MAIGILFSKKEDGKCEYFGKKKMMPWDWEAQWWLSKSMLFSLLFSEKPNNASSEKKRVTYNSTISSRYNIRFFLFTS
jgi:hypothetical protein